MGSCRRADNQEDAPAHAGRGRRRSGRRPPRPRVPRTRGVGPLMRVALKRPAPLPRAGIQTELRAPRTRGDEPGAESADRRAGRSAPAVAGMNRTTARSGSSGRPAPRARGDEPRVGLTAGPTSAVNPAGAARNRRPRRLPRTRGDRPVTVEPCNTDSARAQGDFAGEGPDAPGPGNGARDGRAPRNARMNAGTKGGSTPRGRACRDAGRRKVRHDIPLRCTVTGTP